MHLPTPPSYSPTLSPRLTLAPNPSLIPTVHNISPSTTLAPTLYVRLTLTVTSTSAHRMLVARAPQSTGPRCRACRSSVRARVRGRLRLLGGWSSAEHENKHPGHISIPVGIRTVSIPVGIRAMVRPYPWLTIHPSHDYHPGMPFTVDPDPGPTPVVDPDPDPGPNLEASVSTALG